MSVNVSCDTFLIRDIDLRLRPFCGWCGAGLDKHAYIDTTRWSPAGPFLGPGGVETRMTVAQYLQESA